MSNKIIKFLVIWHHFGNCACRFSPGDNRHKNCQNDVKVLETWWFWHILGKGTHIYSNQKQPDFHQKSPWTPMSHLSPVCLVTISKVLIPTTIPATVKIQQQRISNFYCKKPTIDIGMCYHMTIQSRQFVTKVGFLLLNHISFSHWEEPNWLITVR